MTHLDNATRLVLALMRSASTDKIPPIRWWERAKSALETGAAAADDFATLVSVMGRKLEIDATSIDSAMEIDAVRDAIGDDFRGFRHVCARQALYAVAMAQAARSEQRKGGAS